LRSLEITVGVPCINNCTYCPQKLLLDIYKKQTSVFKMTFDNYKKYLLTVPKDVQIDFSGMAEVFQNEESIDIIRYTDEQEYKIVFYTTLANLNINDLWKIKDIIFKSQVILHLPDCNGLTQIKMDEQYWETLNEIVGLKYGSDLPLISNTYTQPHPDIISRMNMDILNCISLTDSGMLIGRGNNLSNVKKQGKKLGKLKCSSGSNHNVLLPDGSVLNCCMSYNLGENIIGNLNINTYDEIINSAQAQKLQKAMDSEDLDIICRFCERAVLQ
jgi:radical SAM protein with 4Fe4S-binding SPASM domain